MTCPDFVALPGMGAEDIQSIAAHHLGQTASDASWDVRYDLDNDG